MLDEKLQKLLNELKEEFKVDISKAIHSLSTKIKQDVYPKIVEIIGTDDQVKVQEAKKFLSDSTEVIVNDIDKQLKEFLDNY
jgi:allophanate hydrolase subunit 1